ncbi:acetolactate synthase 2 catalytic subunit [Gallaecimonas sp. GXIMD4217]|uniref:acetolactate synthase 2 catalytic subunit n=1 Tax=Gallaecimonas sp. GXIMD4217 TaxID=3131927 RepID=UPI00311B3A52
MNHALATEIQAPSGAELVLAALEREGVQVLFGYPGGAIMPLYDALYQSQLQHVLCRHEQGAALAAIGYARASGKVGVCLATSGPGATNLITGLADAMMDSVPLVAITGQVPREAMGTDAFQEMDVLGLSLGCTKHSFLVKDAAQLPAVLAEAFRLAREGRPGPVLVDLPKDVQQARPAAPLAAPAPEPVSFQPDRQALAEAARLMARAERPLAYVGGGIAMAGALAELRAFLAETHLPVVETLKGLGSADHESPHYLGMLGMHGNQAANLAVQDCDLLLALGARFDDRVTGRLDQFAPRAQVIHLDIDAAELGKRRRPEVALHGCARDYLPLLPKVQTPAPWLAELAGRKAQYRPNYGQPSLRVQAPVLLNRLAGQKSANTRICSDVGQHQMWVAQHMHFDSPHCHLSSGGLGTMGFGLPAAIGAKLACPDDEVIAVCGDGSIMMNIQELGTIRRLGLAVKILLLDNQRLGMVRQWQSLFFDARHSEVDLSDNPDFLALARAFDIPGMHIHHGAQLEAGLAALLSAPGPFLLHVSIHPEDSVWPLVPPGYANHQMLEDTP